MNMSSILPNFRAIVAVCDDWGIGKAGDVLVHNREDMRSFVRHTKGHTVLMGRKTLESFPDAKPLADRRNIVVSRDKSYAPEGVEMARSIDEAVRLAGGDHCLREADTFFPNLDEKPSWEVADIEDGGVTKSGIPFEFVTYRRA